MIPYHEIETLFLDVGNTLVSMDFDWIAAEMARRGRPCDVASLRRAEAAARPELSRWLGGDRSTETGDSFSFYLSRVLSRLPGAAEEGAPPPERLCAELVPILRQPGRSDRLWSRLLPGVREALTSFRELGLELLVVSNSDGTVERGLERIGLRRYFRAVVDSAVVGFEKPDPRIFENALERAGSAPERVVHVGDLYHADVTGARAAGLHALLLDPFDDWGGVDCERAVDLGELARRIRDARAS